MEISHGEATIRLWPKLAFTTSQPSDGLFVTGTWSVIAVSLMTFIMWLVL
jgi:hypothetical protein